MKTLTISLSQQQITRLQQAVASGSYASNSEVMRDALRLWEQREELRELEINRLKHAYDEGMVSGEGRAVDAHSLLAELKA
ncbi:type II toxin-antitoxin system ParD family antitoxin [Hoeflea sp. AS60]|uniref:type II toxin-antitoxin system ParD family antitoxin n=1 Tax=Hoeflea sp. AS60 TaxID=3135780 RepID=UPI003170A7F4